MTKVVIVVPKPNLKLFVAGILMTALICFRPADDIFEILLTFLGFIPLAGLLLLPDVKKVFGLGVIVFISGIIVGLLSLVTLAVLGIIPKDSDDRLFYMAVLGTPAVATWIYIGYQYYRTIIQPKKFLKGLVDLMKVYEDRIELKDPMNIEAGILTIYKHPTGVYFGRPSIIGDVWSYRKMRSAEVTNFMSFAVSNYTMICAPLGMSVRGFLKFLSGMYVPVNTILKTPVYRIVDGTFKDVMVAILKPIRMNVRGNLRVNSPYGDVAETEYVVEGNVLKGVLKFLKSKAKSAKVELCYYVDKGVYARVEIARTKGEYAEYHYPLSVGEPTVLIFKREGVSLSDIFKVIGIKRIISGVEYVLRLTLDSNLYEEIKLTS